MQGAQRLRVDCVCSHVVIKVSRTRVRFSRSPEQWLRLLRLLRYTNQINRQILIYHGETLGQRK